MRSQAWKEAASYFVKEQGNLTHQQRVTRSYRHALKLMMSWAIDRDIIYDQAEKIRASYDANKNRPAGSVAIQQKVTEVEKLIEQMAHPDQYVHPYMPGGSKFMRNSPPPYNIVWPAGDIPDEYKNVKLLNIDQTTARGEPSRHLVDFATKSYK